MLLIIFGAGASYDHDPEIKGIGNAARIPLANQLIDAQLTNAQSALNKWQGAVPVLLRLRRLREVGNFNIEEALYSELKKANNDVNAQLLSFLFYVYEVISSSEASVRSSNQATTNYTRLLDRLQTKGIDESMGLRIVTFNYDTLIEAACAQVYPSWEFKDFDKYLNGPHEIKLYKPHGSLNWQKTMSVSYIDNISSVSALLDAQDSAPFDTSITSYSKAYSTETLASTLVEQPILALPYKEKTNFVFPESHKNALKKDMSDVTHILTVGWRGAEEHFHSEILSRIPEGANLRVLNVNMGGDAVESNLERALEGKIHSMKTYSDGFSAFLSDPVLLDKFLTGI